MSICNSKISLFVVTFQTDNDTLATPQRGSSISTSTLPWNTEFVHWAWSHSEQSPEKNHSHIVHVHWVTFGVKTDQISEDAVLQAERSLDIWKWNQALRPDSFFFLYSSPGQTNTNKIWKQKLINVNNPVK